MIFLHQNPDHPAPHRRRITTPGIRRGIWLNRLSDLTMWLTRLVIAGLVGWAGLLAWRVLAGVLG